MKKHLIISTVLEIILCWGSLENAFSQANAGPDTVILKGTKIKIGSSLYGSSWCFTWTSADNSTISDKKAPQPDVQPLVQSIYSVTVVGPDFSFTDNDDITVDVKDPKVVFNEYENQKYGFDNYGVNKLFPWKSVKNGGTDFIQVNTTPVEDFKYIYFKTIHPNRIEVSPDKASTEEEAVILKGLQTGDTEFHTNFNDKDGYNINRMNIASYNEISLTVGFVRIVEQNDDIQLIGVDSGYVNSTAIEAGNNGILNSVPAGDDKISGNTIHTGLDGICQTEAISDDVPVIQVNKGKPFSVCATIGPNNFWDTKDKYGDDEVLITTITTGPDGVCNTKVNKTNLVSSDIDYFNVESDLRKAYDQAIIKWNVFIAGQCVVNYDLNKNDSLDYGPLVEGAWSAEMLEIINNCGSQPYNKIFFLVDKSALVIAAGMMPRLNKFGFIHPDVNIVNIGNTVAHELGHGLGLEHTYELDDEATTDEIIKDPENLMNPKIVGWKLRKAQWDYLHH